MTLRLRSGQDYELRITNLLTAALLLLVGCANPQPLPTAPTPIPTLIPATLPPPATATPRAAALKVAYPSRQPSAQRAQALYATNCASCHGEDGRGRVPGARNFADADYIRGETPVRFYQIITDGRSAMPGWQDKLSDDQRWDLTFYTIRFAISPETLAEGRKLYEQNCLACHGANGKGVVPGAPDATDIKWATGHAPRDFFQVVTEGRGAMPAWQGRLTPEQRWATIEYMRSFAYEP